MNIIISAYECSPDHGSEAGLGWNWVMCAAQYTDFETVHVITMDRYKDNILRYVDANPEQMTNVKFHFIDLPLKQFKRLNQRFKYIPWQKKVGRLAKEICASEKIDFVHHVTWATCVFPSHLYEAGVPFVYGPVGGGERIPKEVDLKLTARNRVTEWLRNVVFDVAMHLPANHRVFSGATLILATTEETKNRIPKKYRNKVKVMQSIGLNEVVERTITPRNENEPLKVLMAGRMLQWKGFEIAIDAFKQLEKENVNARLKIVGGGRMLSQFKQYAGDCKLIEFTGAVDHNKMNQLYDETDLLLNCSLHDSGCMVVLEALGRGLPVMAIDTGEPKVLLKNYKRLKVRPSSIANMVTEIVYTLTTVENDKKCLIQFSEEASKEAEKYMNDEKYNRIISLLRTNNYGV